MTVLFAPHPFHPQWSAVQTASVNATAGAVTSLFAGSVNFLQGGVISLASNLVAYGITEISGRLLIKIGAPMPKREHLYTAVHLIAVPLVSVGAAILGCPISISTVLILTIVNLAAAHFGQPCGYGEESARTRRARAAAVQRDALLWNAMGDDEGSDNESRSAHSVAAAPRWSHTHEADSDDEGRSSPEPSVRVPYAPESPLLPPHPSGAAASHARFRLPYGPGGAMHGVVHSGEALHAPSSSVLSMLGDAPPAGGGSFSDSFIIGE